MTQTKKGTRRFLLPALFFLVVISSCKGKVTVNELLSEMTDRSHLTYFPEPAYRHVQFSSYNRASVSPGQPGWFENFDMSHFLRLEENNGRREFIMLDQEGPGAIVRWWMTFYKAQDGIIRIYLDGSDTPEYEGTPAELLSGNAIAPYPFSVSLQKGAPLGEEGRDYDHNFYFPIPFAKHCKISYECDLIEKLYELEGVHVPQGFYWPDVFYNIGVRIYEEGTRVETLNRNILNKKYSKVDKEAQKLLEHFVDTREQEDIHKTLAPGDSGTFHFNINNRAAGRFTLKLKAGNLHQAMKSVVISMAFDDHQTVWIPAGEFFGSAYSLKPNTTWFTRIGEEQDMESYRVMPFKDRCRISIINMGSEPVEIEASAGLIRYSWKKNSMYFCAAWHEYYLINSRDSSGNPFDLNFIDIKGKGVYAGDQISLYNDTYHWWGEGDEKIFTDGEAFPSSFGTGSEDYYGYSFARQEAFSHPFLSQPEGRGNMAKGITVNSRLRSLDAIPFHHSLSSNIELWHWKNVLMNYALSSFFYALPPFSINIKPDPQAVRNEVIIKPSDMERIIENRGFFIP